jgi:glycosyltransferase involved in cell wall biosynthesis
VIHAFESVGWKVERYIVGDRLPKKWISGEDIEIGLRSNIFIRLTADVARLLFGIYHSWKAANSIKQCDWAYERFGAFQAMGWQFQKRGIPWILETNELYYINADKDRQTTSFVSLMKRWETWAYRQCDVLVCVSRSLAELIIREIGIPREKVLVIPNGVDTARFNLELHKPKRVFQHPTIGFVGHLSPWQRLDLLIEALAGLRGEGVDFKLVVIGDGPMRSQWEALVERLGQIEQVRFLGRVPWDDVPAYISGFDLGYTGPVPLASGEMYLSPLKLYEYAAMGRPIVAAAYADAQRLMEDGVAVYLFEPGNQEDLCRALRQAYAERDLWVQKGMRSRAIIVERHSWEARVRELISCVESILEAKYGTPYPARRHS